MFMLQLPHASANDEMDPLTKVSGHAVPFLCVACRFQCIVAVASVRFFVLSSQRVVLFLHCLCLCSFPFTPAVASSGVVPDSGDATYHDSHRDRGAVHERQATAGTMLSFAGHLRNSSGHDRAGSHSDDSTMQSKLTSCHRQR